MATLFGIPNCDTVRKARKWLDANEVAFDFVDFKKTPPSKAEVLGWLRHIPLEVLLNKRSTTWRNLPDADKTDITESKAITLMMNNPSLIKRPVFVYQNTALAGFSEKTYQEIL